MTTTTKTNSSQQDEYRQAFLRHLPKRIEAVELRINRYRREGWEAGGMALLNDDVQRLAGASGRYDLIEPSQHLLTLEQMLGEHIARRTLPDAGQSERMLALTAAVTASLIARPDAQQRSAHSEVAPEGYWRRWVGDAPAIGAMPAPAAAQVHAGAAANDARPAPAAAASGGPRHIYHLSNGNPLAFEVEQRLESEGFEVEAVETVDELTELLMALSPQLVLVDASRMSDLTAVGTQRREVQAHAHNQAQKIHLVAMAAQDNLQSRLDARRAGVDALLFPPFSATDVVKQLQALLAPAEEEKLRILIVEDDRAQALFAQSVLTNAGMQAHVEQDPLHVLESLESFKPDLVLMDLHMPHANGVELTAMIREHPAFMRTPIVFLSGENDPDARFDAINAGGDDFLTKPIRPKHLIASVQNRVRRVRSLAQAAGPAMSARDEATGLCRRAFVLDKVNDALAASHEHPGGGGALFLEIDGAAALRDRLGLGALEALLVAAGRLIAGTLADMHVAARINDNAFLVLALELDDAALDALAKRLRDRILGHEFEAVGKPMRLRASVGICPLRFGFGDASALLNTAERACRDARTSETGVRRYEPPRPAELDQETALIEQIREAIGNDGFGLIYQPIVAVQGGQDAQYQTLLRMRDAEGKLRAAAEILPLAEKAGLMIDIDRWVLTRAMSVIGQQRESGRSVRLFVPQSMATFGTRDQAGWLKAELAANMLSGESLVLECRLEDALLNPPVPTAFANAMRPDGVKLCLGQYQHSADSARLLESIPLGFLKVGGQYVAANAPQAVRDELRQLIDRAHQLGIQVIGHRVEDAQAAAALWMGGIDFIQGNLVQGATGGLDFDFNAAVL